MTHRLDSIDRAIVRETAPGLPLVAEPYSALAERVGTDSADVMRRMRRMLAEGVIRRIGAVPNHYALGLSHNAMTVWDVADDEIARLGAEIGALDFVTHCYHRPRHPPLWPYNLFAMVHGRSRGEIDTKIDAIAGRLGPACRGHDVLFSTRILKKTGLRLAG
jgi:DNA-binding Lrp family transcriptional regulator